MNYLLGDLVENRLIMYCWHGVWSVFVYMCMCIGSRDDLTLNSYHVLLINNCCT